MSADELVHQAITILLDADTEQLGGEQPLTAIEGWDSVNALRVLAYLERSLNMPLDYEQFHTATTVGDLVAAVQVARAQAGAAR